MTACRGCGAEMIWALSPGGQKCPIVPAPSEDGNVLLLAPTGLDSPLAIVLSGDVLDQARRHGVALRLNHFSNCPKAASFRPKAAA